MYEAGGPSPDPPGYVPLLVSFLSEGYPVQLFDLDRIILSETM
jgi:hypothetical protein